MRDHGLEDVMAGEELDVLLEGGGFSKWKDHNELRLSAADMDSNGSSGGRRKGSLVWEVYAHLVVETDEAPESTESLGHMQRDQPLHTQKQPQKMPQ
jgi:hypothetical protein